MAIVGPMSGEESLAGPLEKVLAEVLATPVRVEHLRLLSGGASRETWSFDAVADAARDTDSDASDMGGDGSRRRLVLQRMRGGAEGMHGPTMQQEDALLDAARRRGVPVPATVVDAATAAKPLGHARVSEHVEGETIGARIVRGDALAAARPLLTAQIGAALAGIHAIDPGEVEGLGGDDPLDALRAGLDLVGEARPAFEIALRWLADNRPPSHGHRVVHGDFRVGNLIVDRSGLRAVIDWELAHLGDPVEDLGWLCVRSWRFGGSGVVGGIGDLEELIAAYRAAGGVPVDAQAVHWWIVAGTLRWGLICAVQARRHLGGEVPSVELATIGRRTAETEYDLLDALDMLRTVPEQTGAVDLPPDLHGRPTAAELVDAVRDHLATRVMSDLEGAAAFQLKVAINALGIVERELRATSGAQLAHQARLRCLGFEDEASLAAAIRSGAELGLEVQEVVSAAVLERLRVANPKWIRTPSEGHPGEGAVPVQPANSQPPPSR